MKRMKETFKRILAMTLVCLMTASVMTMGVAYAANEDDVWQEISKLNFYSEDDNKDTTLDVSNTTYVFKKTIANGQTVECSGNAGTGGAINIGAWRDDRTAATAEGDTAPAELSNKVLAITRKWVSNSAGMRPTSYFQISNLFDTSTIKVGDRIRVNAWVNAWVNDKNNVYSFDSSTNKSTEVTPENPVGVRMWLGETMGTEGIATTMMPLKWKKLSFEYVVTDANKNINTIRIDNSSSETTVYTHKTYLGAVTVEKLLTNNEALATVDFASFTTTTKPTSTGGTSYVGTATSSNGKTYNVTVPKGDAYRVAQYNTFTTPASTTVTGTAAIGGDYVFQLDRRRVGSNSGAQYPPNYLGANISGDFGEISAGDKIRVTACLGTSDVKIYNGVSTKPTEIEGEENAKTSVVRIRLMDANSEVIAETTNSSFPNLTWSTITCEFTMPADKSLSKIVIDAGEGSGKNYAQKTYISGINVDKINETEGTYSINEGTVSGNVFVGVVKGENQKVLVAAYSDKRLIGVDIQDYILGTNEYNFSIEDVAEADQVICYVWNEVSLCPLIDQIPLELSSSL